KEILLDFIPIRSKHTSASLAACIKSTLIIARLKKRLLAITCNNASYNIVIT
ncbi:hypothetical protein EJ07DRAFT_137978, partial [Lizonia empirigonia]